MERNKVCGFLIIKGVEGLSDKIPRICFVIFSFCSCIRRCHRIGVQSLVLYANNLTLVSETIQEFRNTFMKRIEVFQSMNFKVIFWKTKMIIKRGSMNHGVSMWKLQLDC